MKKKEFVEKIKTTFEVETIAEAGRMLEKFEGIIKEALEDGEKVDLGIVTLIAKMSNPRTARNPQTGDTIEVPAKGTIKAKIKKTYQEELTKKLGE